MTTKQQRREVYWQLYFVMEGYRRDPEWSDGFCWTLKSLNAPHLDELPELMAQRHNYPLILIFYPLTSLWFRLSPEGFAQRQECCLKAIAKTME